MEQRNGRVKWIIGVIWTLAVATAGFLAAETYRGTDRQLQAHETRIDALETQDAAIREAQKQFRETVAEIKATQAEFRKTVDRLQERKR